VLLKNLNKGEIQVNLGHPSSMNLKNVAYIKMTANQGKLFSWRLPGSKSASKT